MAKCSWVWALGIAAIAAAPLRAQSAADVANLREDINGLSQRVADLTLRVEQLETQVQAAKTSRATYSANSVTPEQLSAAVADLTAQMERLRASVSAPAAAAPTATETPAPAKKAAGFSDDFPKQGVSYEVQKGDTLALIAKKTGGKFADIVNANKLADPSKIRIGQKLFIPGGK